MLECRTKKCRTKYVYNMLLECICEYIIFCFVNVFSYINAYYEAACYVVCLRSSDVKAIVIKLCDLKTNVIDLWQTYKWHKTWFKAHGFWRQLSRRAGVTNANIWHKFHILRQRLILIKPHISCSEFNSAFVFG